MAERELLIWLRPTVSPQSAAAFKSVADMAKKSQKGIAEGHRKVVQKQIAEDSAYAKARGKTDKQIQQEDLARFKVQQAQIKQRAAEEKRAAAEVAREKRKHEAEERRAQQQRRTEERRQAAEQARETRQQTAESRRAEQQAERGRQKEEREKERTTRSEERQYKLRERAEERVGKLRMNAMAASMHMGEKLLQVGRGAALIGLSREDQSHVLEKLEMIQGGFDVAQGGVSMLRTGQHALHAWRQYRKTAAAARGGIGLAKAAGIAGDVGTAAMGAKAGLGAMGVGGATAAAGGAEAAGAGAAGAGAAAGGSALASPVAIGAAVVGSILVGLAALETSKSNLKHGGKGRGWEGDTWYGRPMQAFGEWWNGSEKKGKEREEQQTTAAEKYWQFEGPRQHARQLMADQSREVAHQARAEMVAHVGMVGYAHAGDIAESAKQGGYSFGAEAAQHSARAEAMTAHSNTRLAESRVGEIGTALEEARTVQQQRLFQPATAVTDQQKVADLARLTDLTEQYTKAVHEAGDAAAEEAHKTLGAEQAEIDKIKEKLDTRKAGLLGMAGETPEDKAKTTWAVQQARAHGIESLSPEMQGLAMRASAADPEWQRKFQAQQMEHEAPEFEKRWGMKAGEALAPEEINRAGGGTAKVDVRTTNHIEIVMHEDVEAIMQKLKQVMDAHTKKWKEAADRSGAAQASAQAAITAPG